VEQSAPEGFQWATITPPVEGLACRFLQPVDWEIAELPHEPQDFSEPDRFMPLALCIARFGACVFSVAARPAFSEGTVLDWFRHIASLQGLEPEGFSPGKVGDHDAVACFATQPSEAGPMRMRLSLFEDGGNLYNVSVLAPAQIWPSVEPLFIPMVQSFALLEPKGPTVPIAPEEEEGGGETETTYASVALADDASSLDPEHPINANIRDGGNGFAPNVAAIDTGRKCATVAVGAIVATFNVPFGWHVIDDGRRTLVFNASGEVQVNLNLLDPEGQSDGDILMGVLEEMQGLHPDLQHLQLELAGMKCLALRNVRDGDALLEQAYLVRPAYNDLLLKTRVTATPEWMVRAMDLAGLIHQDLRFLQ
jgi:hypothetical protein